jgi:quinol monooxygenase YgiN
MVNDFCLEGESAMGLISIAAFTPKRGKEAELLKVIDDRLPLLRRLGLATDRAEIRCRSKDRVIISISEWTDQAAIDRAHTTPEVLALWGRFAACCEWVKLTDIAECKADFATFEAI